MMIKLIVVEILLLQSVTGSEDQTGNSMNRQKKSLLFPRFSQLQTSMCLIAQISSLPSHRVALNIGFQTNYILPSDLPSFYSPVFWARKFSHTSNPLVNFFEKMVESDDEFNMNNQTNGTISRFMNSSLDVETTTVEEMESTDQPKAVQNMTNETMEIHERKKRMLTFESDITAGMFYSGIVEVLEYAGYHEYCLLKSICELAKHPLALDDENEDVTREVLHFFLTPSAHKSFDPENESEDKELYEEAERIGSEGGDCELIYSECKVSPLYSISNFVPSI